MVSAAHVAAGLSAKEWCDHCVAVAAAQGGSGKGGGRAELANATIVPGPGADAQQTTTAILEAARLFAAAIVPLKL
jgi:hypothetical protein